MPEDDSRRPPQGAGEETASSPGRANIGGVPGGRIGPYKLLSLLGEGGFGVVYLAEQTKPGMDTRAVLARPAPDTASKSSSAATGP